MMTGIDSASRLADDETGREPVSGLDIRHLRHRFADRTVVDGVDLAIPQGEIHCLVGPSGCGKTTTLRLIAGLESLQEGVITIKGREVGSPNAQVAPEKRHVGLMFQDFALFPHLNVEDNIAFGIRKLARMARQDRVRELLAQVNMQSYAASYPQTLSGGEQQRVALARALAPGPDLMLLDEAFSALDTSLRTQVREDTLALLRTTGTATLLVTHDAEEAVRSGDRIHVMQAGRIVQSGTPSDLYYRPTDAFVASFFVAVNRYAGKVRGGAVETIFGSFPAVGLAEGENAEVIVRSEGVRVRSEAGETGVDASAIEARVVAIRDLGPLCMLWLEMADGSIMRVRAGDVARVRIDDTVRFDLDAAHVFIFPVRP